MRSMVAITLALALLSGAPLSTRAEITLIEPVALNAEIDDLRNSLSNSNADPGALRAKAGSIFQEAAERTHHRPVDGIGQWERPEALSKNGEEVQVNHVMEGFKGLVIKPIPSPEMDRIDRGLAESYVAAEKVHQSGKMRKAENGELDPAAIAAYLWDPAKAALGTILFQPRFFSIASYIGEFALASVVHEGSHAWDPNLSPVEVKKGEKLAFHREADALIKMERQDSRFGQKFVYAWINTVEKAGVPEYVKDYVKHLAKLRWHHHQGSLDAYITELGYQDRHGHAHAERLGHHPGDGHDHGERAGPGKG